eukprot:45280-Amphidinium_carterae.1
MSKIHKMLRFPKGLIPCWQRWEKVLCEDRGRAGGGPTTCASDAEGGQTSPSAYGASVLDMTT